MCRDVWAAVCAHCAVVVYGCEVYTGLYTWPTVSGTIIMEKRCFPPFREKPARFAIDNPESTNPVDVILWLYQVCRILVIKE